MGMHSHYDNLKVARNAPPEVIRAAYKALSQKWHPDRNGDPEAHRYMAIINAAYVVLSDPTKRKEHDDWLDAQDGETHEHQFQERPPESGPTDVKPKRKRAFDIDDGAFSAAINAPQIRRRRSIRNRIIGVVTFFVICLLAGIYSGRN